MFESPKFKSGDPAIKRFFLPGDYMSRLRDKFVPHFGEAVIINPNAWAVNSVDPRNVAVEGLWKMVIATIEENPAYQGTLAMPLRNPDKSIASLIYIGNGEVLEAPEVEAIRLQVVGDVNAYAEVAGQGLQL
jgi:hypothetical protein